MLLKKTYSVKVFDKSGNTFRGEFPLLDEYRIEKNINGGVGPLSFTIARKFDDYNADGLINLLDCVEIWLQDKETHGRRVYSGLIDNIEAGVDETGETVTLNCIGHTSRFSQSLDWDGTNIRLKRSGNVANIMKDVIDNYRTRYSNPFINYTAGSVDTTGNTAKLTFPSFSVLESIEAVRMQGGTDWYWYVDADRVFYYLRKPTTPTHTFSFGKHLSSYKKSKSVTDLKNVFLYWNGLQKKDKNFISKRYYNTTSINDYWDRYEISNDPTIKDVTTANQLGTAFVSANKSPNIRLRFTVKDSNLDKNGYDIESIEPGHTCCIINTKDPDLYSGNLTITKVILTPSLAEIEVEDRSYVTAKRLEQIRRKISNQIGSDGVTTVTSSSV